MWTRLIAVLAPAVCIAHATAATYYIDATNGNDNWSGQLAAASGSPPTNGPWRTLSKLTSVTLTSGDSVLLKCGETWRQPLRLNGSGSSSSIPVKVGAYPAGCANRPTIDGSIPIAAGAWTTHSGSIYKTSLAGAIMASSSFDASLNGWGRYSPNGDATLAVDSNCGTTGPTCLRFTSGGGTANSIAYSSEFPLQAGQSYNTSFYVNAPVGVRVWAVVRRTSPPYEAVGFSVLVDGTGSWQRYSYSFTASASLGNARLDFELPRGGITARIDEARVESPTAVTPRQVFVDSDQLNIAHHPNRGFNPSRPQSVYLTNAENTGRSYLATGSDLVLPGGATLAPGIGVRVLGYSWVLDERTVTSVQGNRLYFNTPTTLALERGWGYYLFGALWMLDRPGEWYFDAGSKTLYTWMPDGGAPGSRVAAGHMDVGIDVSGLSYVTIDGLFVRRVGTGVRMRNTNGVVLRNSVIADTAGQGIDAVLARNAAIENNVIRQTGREAIFAADYINGGTASALRVTGNDITDSGMRVKNGVVVSLPVGTGATILPGLQAMVTNNRVINSAYMGVYPLVGATITDNSFENSCMVLDDCAAIYIHGRNHNSTVARNLVIHARGTTDGKPLDGESQAQGIYLDENADNVSVIGNTVVDADNGIQLHNVGGNRVEENTLYGNRRYQLWMQEDSTDVRAQGDLFSNVISKNLFFPTGNGPSIAQDTIYSNTHSFATYDYNRYSTLLSPRIAAEQWNGGWGGFTFAQWQQARNSSGVLRNLDPNGSEVAGRGYATSRVTGGTIMFNGDFASGISRWAVWNATAPYAQSFYESCTPGRCLRFVAGASPSILSSPNFSIVKDRWYRASFDLRAGTDGQGVAVVVRRGGGGANGYEWLMPAPEGITATTAWKRYSFVFKATQSVNENDPVTQDRGARLDFDRIQPGQTITISNVEIVPVSPVDASLKTHILYNPDRAAAALRCPQEASDPAVCGRYVRFTDGAAVSWPYAVQPRRSEIIYAQDTSLADADGDGIANTQDACAGSPAGAAVNAAGCALGQR